MVAGERAVPPPSATRLSECSSSGGVVGSDARQSGPTPKERLRSPFPHPLAAGISDRAEPIQGAIESLSRLHACRCVHSSRPGAVSKGVVPAGNAYCDLRLLSRFTQEAAAASITIPSGLPNPRDLGET